LFDQLEMYSFPTRCSSDLNIFQFLYPLLSQDHLHLISYQLSKGYRFLRGFFPQLYKSTILLSRIHSSVNPYPLLLPPTSFSNYILTNWGQIVMNNKLYQSHSTDYQDRIMNHPESSIIDGSDVSAVLLF